MTPRTACVAVLALAAAAGPAAAQISSNIGRPRHPFAFNVGTVGGYRPLPPVYRAPAIGVVAPPVVRPSWPVPPVVSLRPTIYPAAYLNLFAPGYQTILAGDVAYYYYPALPPGAAFVTVGGAGYYRAGGLWYQPYWNGGQNVYLIVPPPL
jgi:hypothetical protein